MDAKIESFIPGKLVVVSGIANVCSENRIRGSTVGGPCYLLLEVVGGERSSRRAFSWYRRRCTQEHVDSCIALLSRELHLCGLNGEVLAVNAARSLSLSLFRVRHSSFPPQDASQKKRSPGARRPAGPAESGDKLLSSLLLPPTSKRFLCSRKRRGWRRSFPSRIFFSMRTFARADVSAVVAPDCGGKAAASAVRHVRHRPSHEAGCRVHGPGL